VTKESNMNSIQGLRELPLFRVPLVGLPILVGVLLFSSPSLAESDGFKEVTVTGVADIEKENLGEARKAAILNAQRNAIEEVVGAYIESTFTQTQREAVNNELSSFYARVEDRLRTKSSGYIQSQKVVAEGQEKKTYFVKLWAKVSTYSIGSELEKLKEALKDAGNPKVMLVLDETFVDDDGEFVAVERPSITSVLEDLLLRQGFELIAKDQFEKLRREEMKAFSKILGDNKEIAKVASKYGAEVGLVGTCVVKKIGRAGGKLQVSALTNLRAVNASTAQIMASIETIGKGAGKHMDLARVSATRDAAPEVMEKLIRSMVQAWQKQSEEGKRFRVILVKAEHYNRVARPFIKKMKQLAATVQVKEISYGGGRLELEVIYKGSKRELLDGIFDEIASAKLFENLDKVLDRGDSIELTL